MRWVRMLCMAMLAGVSAQSAYAGDMTIAPDTVYGRVGGGIGFSGAVFFDITNEGETPDSLIGVRSNIARRVELHTHEMDENGVMRMLRLPEGLSLPAGETHRLKRGGDHVMLMGLNRALDNGDSFFLTLIFENAGEVVVEVNIENER